MYGALDDVAEVELPAPGEIEAVHIATHTVTKTAH